MGAPVVVVVFEVVELPLEPSQVLGRRAGGEPAFEGLVEAFDLALGLGVVGAAVALLDAVLEQRDLEAVGGFRVAGGEDVAVVGEGGGGLAVLLAGFAELVADGLAGDRPVAGDGEDVAGVVVEEDQDLGVLPVGQAAVGEVGLPALVGQLGLEPEVGGSGGICAVAGRPGRAG